MKHKRNPIAAAVNYALGAGALAGMVMTGAPAFAQDEETAIEQRVQVTGSRIKRVDVETTSPVTVVTSEQILASGLQNVGDVLRNLNQADSLGLSNLTNITNGNDGTQTISLRGLGSTRTLILVNGRRWIGLGGGQVDITQIPVALVERIEVLADGASAIYGSDAIAGVINIITRSDYDGLEVEMSMGSNFEGDGEVTTMGATMGLSGSRSSAYLNVSKTEQKPITAGDREISEFPIQFIPRAAGSSFSEHGRFFVPGRGHVALRPDRRIPGLLPQDRTTADFEPLGPQHFFNFAPENYLLTPSDRLTTFAGGHYDLTDNVRAFAQFTFNQRKSVTRIASVPLTMFFSGPQWQIPISASNIYNPFGVDIRGVGFRTTPLGPRTSTQDYDTYFGTTGLEGFFTFADRTIDWDVFYSRGEASRYTRGTNYVNLLNLRNGLGPSFIDPVTGARNCGVPGAVIAGCVPINLFNSIEGVTQAMANYMRGDLSEQERSGLINYGVNFTGEIVDLPAGALAFAAGYENRKSTYADVPDSLIVSGLSSNNFREPTVGQQAVDEFYAEFAIPLLSDMPGAQMLEFTAAVRVSDYTNNGLIGVNPIQREFDNTSTKFGILWQPFEDLLVRANIAETFRSPPVSTMFGGGGESFNTVTDPCTNNATLSGVRYVNLTAEQQARCHATGVPIGGSLQATAQIRNLIGGNPNVLPESGDTTTVGFVYNPGWMPNLDMSLDYWRIEMEDVLSARSPLSVLNGCYGIGGAGVNPADCAFIERGAGGQITTLRRGSGNLAFVDISGVDMNSNYRFDTADMGSFSMRLNMSWTREALLTTGNLADAVNVVSRAEGAFGSPTWRLRGNLTTNWMYGDFGVAWTIRYLSRLSEDCSGFEDLFEAGIATREICSDENAAAAFRRDPDQTGDGPTAINDVGSVFYHDLSASWRAPWNATVRVGLRNAFRKDPPFMISPFANSFDQAYDIPGGFWFLSYRQSL